MTAPAPTSPRRTRRPVRVRLSIGAVALVVAIGGAACGGGGNDAAAAPSTTTGTAATAPPTTSTTTAPSTTAPSPTVPPTTATGASGSTGSTGGGRPLRLVAIGDSYSAGNGGSTKEQDVSATCSRDPVASIGTLAQAGARAAGLDLDLDLRACSGGTIAQVTQQATGVRDADAISVTFGGNDLGFSRIIADCLLRGCRSYDQPGDRLPGLAHDSTLDDWDVLENRLVTALGQLRAGLAPQGRVYVFTYPIPFPAQPAEACLQTAAPFSETSRMLVNAATDRLDRAITDAAAAANTAAGTPYVDVVEWRTGMDRPLRRVTDANGVVREVRDDPNGICGPEPFVNGVTASELGDSFHPTDRGHAYAADALVRALRTRTGR